VSPRGGYLPRPETEADRKATKCQYARFKEKRNAPHCSLREESVYAQPGGEELRSSCKLDPARCELLDLNRVDAAETAQVNRQHECHLGRAGTDSSVPKKSRAVRNTLI
jgi:hypothetical protein